MIFLTQYSLSLLAVRISSTDIRNSVDLPNETYRGHAAIYRDNQSDSESQEPFR